MDKAKLAKASKLSGAAKKAAKKRKHNKQQQPKQQGDNAKTNPTGKAEKSSDKSSSAAKSGKVIQSPIVNKATQTPYMPLKFFAPQPIPAYKYPKTIRALQMHVQLMLLYLNELTVHKPRLRDYIMSMAQNYGVLRGLTLFGPNREDGFFHKYQPKDPLTQKYFDIKRGALRTQPVRSVLPE